MIPNKRQMRWKKNQVFSLKLRNGSFVLIQMLPERGRIAVFNIFRDEDRWDDVTLMPSDVLFYCIIVRSILVRSVTNTATHVSGIEGLALPESGISIGLGFRQLTFWAGTDDERTFLMLGQGLNSVRHIDRKGGKVSERYSPIPPGKYKNYVGLDLTNLRDYPEFNERLYLCCLKRKNFDPLKELAFNRPLGIECKVYVDIISGKTRISSFGY